MFLLPAAPFNIVRSSSPKHAQTH